MRRRVEGGRGEGKSRERTMPRRAELSEPFSLAFTGEEGGSAPAPPRGEAFPAGDQRRPEHAAVGEQHQLVWLRGRPAPRPRASPTTDPPKPGLWNAGDGEERRGSWPQPGLGQTGSMWHSSDLQLRMRGPRTCTGWSRRVPGSGAPCPAQRERWLLPAPHGLAVGQCRWRAEETPSSHHRQAGGRADSRWRASHSPRAR